jgi:hypothetical protein
LPPLFEESGEVARWSIPLELPNALWSRTDLRPAGVDGVGPASSGKKQASGRQVMARRRKLDATELRTSHISLQLTPTERRLLDERVEASGVPKSEYVRAALFGYRVASRIEGDVLTALNRVGVNLNQVAYHLNEARIYGPGNPASYVREYRHAIAAVIDDVKQAISVIVEPGAS